LEVRRLDDLETAFAAVKQTQAGAVNVLDSPFFFANRVRIVEAVGETRLPAIYQQRSFVEAGGLMSYGPHFADLFRRAATFVDKILRGVRPADLPVEQPTKFELAINVKTAKALGVTFLPSILIRADHMIE
jgi:putative ABC transport system substrate-binding protein